MAKDETRKSLADVDRLQAKADALQAEVGPLDDAAASALQTLTRKLDVVRDALRQRAAAEDVLDTPYDVDDGIVTFHVSIN